MSANKDSEARSGSDDNVPKFAFEYGSVVATKLGRFPWWPSMVDICPDTDNIFWPEKPRKEPTFYNVVFFDVSGKVKRSWVKTGRIMHYRSQFPETLTEKDREAVKSMKESNPNRRLMVARIHAEDALQMTVQARINRFSFMFNYKGKITRFDDDGKKRVTERGRAANGPVDETEQSESVKSKKKPGPKVKPTTSTESTKKVAPIRIRKKPGPKPRNKSLPVEYETFTEPSTRTTRSSSASTIPETDTTPSTPKRMRRTRASYQIVAAVSPPSSKPTCVPRATHELAQELSVFAASYPVDEGSPQPIPNRSEPQYITEASPPPSPIAENPKRKYRKRKQASKTTGKKRGRPFKFPAIGLTAELPPGDGFPKPLLGESSIVSIPTPAASYSDIQPLQVVVEANKIKSPVVPQSSGPLVRFCKALPTIDVHSNVNISQTDVQSKALVLRTPGIDELNRLQPSENCLENKMESFLSRIKKETKPQLNPGVGKTISNLNLLVTKTEEGPVIDLTDDNDHKYSLRCGEVVFANLKGFQPWPAVIVMDPEINHCFMPKPEAPNCVHVVFLQLNRRAWVPIENIAIFEQKKINFESQATLNYEKFCKALLLAQQAQAFSREQRSLLYANNLRNVPMTGAPILQ